MKWTKADEATLISEPYMLLKIAMLTNDPTPTYLAIRRTTGAAWQLIGATGYDDSAAAKKACAVDAGELEWQP